MTASLGGYRKGNEVSERQWADVQGILKVRGQELDATYLRTWALELGITDLLERAWREAGLSGS